MVDLIEQLGRATGPDRQLDAALWIACFDPAALDGSVTIEPRGSAYAGREALCTALGSCWADECSPALLNFTASADAALTLLPKDTRLTLAGCNQSWYAALNSTPNEPVHSAVHGFASTPAVAIAIAAVKARASMYIHHPGEKEG